MTTRFRKALTSVALALTLPLIALVSGAEAGSRKTVSELINAEAASREQTAQDLLGSGITSYGIGLTTVTPVVETIHRARFSNATALSALPSGEKSTVDASAIAQADTAESTTAQGFTVPVEDTFAPLTDDELRQLLLVDPNFEPGAPKPSPASGFLTPSGYGADWGDAFVGLSYVTQGDTDTKADGSISAGLGFGNAVDNVGVEVSLGIISLDGFGEDGTIGVKLHKIFPQADNLAVAVGWSNAIKWGDANNSEETFYGVVTKRFDLQPGKSNTLPLTASLGIGTGSFRSTGAIAAGDNAPNVFGSLGLRVIPEVSVVSGWTGSALGLGVSAAPFDFPLVFTVGVSDVTGNTASGARFNASAGYSFSF
ncbi:MAG: hypothetical protein AAF703_01150 [Cyanobacteria bacterium P01_D01_bin.105]